MITVTKEPIKYTPANNPVVFTLSGNSNDLVLFKLQLKEATTNATIYTGNLYPTPVNPNKASLSLTKQLSALVKSDVDNTDDIVIGKPRNILGYKVSATEYGITSGGTLSAMTSGYTTGSFYAFEADLDIQNFTGFKFNNYVLTTASTGTTKFLTYQPNNKSVNSDSSEQLYFMQSGFTSLDVKVVAGGNNYDFIISGGSVPSFGIKNQRQDDQATYIFTLSGTPHAGDVVTVTYYYSLAMTPVVFTSTVLTGWTVFNVIADLMTQISADTRFDPYLTHPDVGIICTAMVELDGFASVATSSFFVGEIDDKMIRVQASPKKLIQAGVNLTGIPSYTVNVKASSTGTTLSETRTYKIEQPECGLDYVNVLFTNSLGGVDSIQLVNPQESTNTTKQTIKRNNINLDSEDVYLTNNKYNTSEEVYDVTSKYSFKAYTQALTDMQAEWLNEMVTSKQHFIELKTGELLPVMLKTSNFKLQKRKYLQQELNIYQFEFELPDGFIPALTSNKLTIN